MLLIKTYLLVFVYNIYLKVRWVSVVCYPSSPPPLRSVHWRVFFFFKEFACGRWTWHPSSLRFDGTTLCHLRQGLLTHMGFQGLTSIQPCVSQSHCAVGHSWSEEVRWMTAEMAEKCSVLCSTSATFVNLICSFCNFVMSSGSRGAQTGLSRFIFNWSN